MNLDVVFRMIDEPYEPSAINGIRQAILSGRSRTAPSAPRPEKRCESDFRLSNEGPRRLIIKSHQSFRKSHLSFFRLRANIGKTTIAQTPAHFPDFRRQFDAPLV
jgi:hypothetical protein